VTITAQENPGRQRQLSDADDHRQLTLFRPLGLGYANLGALLMSRGLAYDSAEGQAYAAAITSIMTAEAYRQSRSSPRDHGGPFAEYRKNEAPFLRVIEKHRDAAHGIPDKQSVPADMHRAARIFGTKLCLLDARHGFRNAQTSLLAPRELFLS